MSNHNPNPKGSIRKPAVSGMFYPSEEKKLKEIVENLMNLAEGDTITNLHGIIVPHAGYIYSGRTACYAYKKLSKKFKKIIILGPNHAAYTDKAVIDDNDYWETPLGNVKIKRINDFEINGFPHHKEHSIEVNVPFFQYLFGNDILLTPIVVGDIEENEIKVYAEKIISELDDETLLVISTDLSHFHNLDAAKEIDSKTIENIEELGDEINACGENPLKILKEICKIKDWKINFIHYSTSADATEDESRVVGYASFWF